MAFSDLCHISNAFKAVENEVDQSERIMEENAMVRDLITKILDESGPTEGSSSMPPPEKSVISIPPSLSQYPSNDAACSFMPSPSSFPYNNNLFNTSNENGYDFQTPNGFSINGFVNLPDNDVNSLLTIDPMCDETVTPEQLYLLRLAAQEIGGAQFQSPNKDDKFYNFFEPNQRNSLPEANMYPNTYSRPNSLNIDTNYNSNFDAPYNPGFPNKFENGFLQEQNQDATELLAYLNQLTLSNDRQRDELLGDFKMPLDLGGGFQDELKLQEERNKMFLNGRNYQQPNKFNGENYYLNDMMLQMSDRNLGQFDFSNPSNSPMSYKPNGYHQNEYMQRHDLNQLIQGREGYPSTNGDRSFENMARDSPQQMLLRQQELARQMSMLINRPPPNQLNVDVSFFHENTPFNLGLGAILGPSPPQVPPPVLPSPMLDLPVMAPYYTMRNMRSPSSSSSILHSRLDACYEQWRQLERERKRTEARLALAYPGRAVSSSNSIPVPRLPPCPTRVDRLTVDMLREHTKVLTLMGKMETLRASVCVAQNKKANKVEESKITVLKRGQDNVAEKGVDPATFDPASWRDDIKNLAEMCEHSRAPHGEVESAMLAWRSAVAGVQAARRRELAPPAPPVQPAPGRYARADPILQLAAAVKQLCNSARRARCAMWCDLTLTVALAPYANESSPPLPTQSSPKQPQESPPTASNTSKPTVEQKEEKPTTEAQPPKTDAKQDTEQKNKQPDKDKSQNYQRRTQNNRKVNNRHDYYAKNQRYNNQFVHRYPYHYLATGPIN